jgi:putative flippase GtrA
MIFPSFWLHRHITFRDKTMRSAFSYTTVKVYVVYILSPFVASIFTYYYLVWFPDIINFSVKVNWLLNYNLPLGKYFLQATSLAIGMLINYSGQRLWIYK